MKTFAKFSLSLSFAIPFALALSGCPGDDGDGELSGNFCQHECSTTADCMVGGMDLGLTCDANTCTGETAGGCTDDVECQATFSGWVTPCTAGGGECDLTMQVCVDVGGSGLCATPPGAAIDCAALMMEEIEVTDIDGAAATVCGNSTAQCNGDGACFDPCQDDSDCVAGAPVCNTGTGLCECGSDTDCADLGIDGITTCNAGACGCGSDQDCIDGNFGGDMCIDGACGCSGDAVCDNITNPYDGGTIACSPI